MFYTEPAELLQYCNNVLAVFCGICIHSHIILRLLIGSCKTGQYRNLLILQSLLYIGDSILKFFIGYIEKTDGKYTFGQPFLPLGKFKRDLCGTAADIILHLELAQLASFNIYRTSLVIRRRFLLYCYVIVAVATSATIAIAIAEIFVTHVALRLFGFVISINSALPTLVCYAAINRHFKTIRSSDKVKKMHTKLSRILLLQVFLQLVNLSIMFLDATVFSIEGSIFKSAPPAEAVKSIYWITTFAFLQWFPAIMGFLIKWSIRGLIRNNDNTINKCVFNVKMERRA